MCDSLMADKPAGIMVPLVGDHLMVSTTRVKCVMDGEIDRYVMLINDVICYVLAGNLLVFFRCMSIL